MDDPPPLRNPGDTGEPSATGVGPSRWTATSVATGRPNPGPAADVSPPVMTVSMPKDLGVGYDPDARGGPNRRGERRFRRPVCAHYDRLVRSLTVASGDREQAADAVQEAFVKAHVRWRRIRRYDDPIGWVRRVAINQLRDDHRRPAASGALARLAARHADLRTARRPGRAGAPPRPPAATATHCDRAVLRRRPVGRRDRRRRSISPRAR